MGCGDHWNRLPSEVDPEAAAGVVDVREALAQEFRFAVGDVEEDRVVARAFQFGVDRAGDDVARGEVLHGVVVLHEGVASVRAQDPALTANRFADEFTLRLWVVEAGRVELHELHVGQARTRAVRHRHAVTRGDVGVGGVEVDLARTTSREQHDARLEELDLLRRDIEHVGSEDAVVAGQARLACGQQVDRAMVLEQAHVGMRAGTFEQSAFDFAAGRVAVMQDPALRVAALAAEVERGARFAGAVEVELGAEFAQRVDHGGAALDHMPDHGFVAQAVAGHERVVDVAIERVITRQHRGDAALGAIRCGIRCLLLGHDCDAAVLGDTQAVVEARDSAADYQDVEFELLGQRTLPAESSTPAGFADSKERPEMHR